MAKPYVQNQQLADELNELYRENATIGSGSTADAIRHELATGQQVGGKWHSQKGNDAILFLEKWLNNSPTASPGGRAAAENVVKDLKDALGR